MNMKKLSVFLVYLLFFSAAIAKPTTPLPIEGTWKIISYQIVGYPAMSEAQTKNWIGKVVEFNEETATLYDDENHQVCPKLDYQVMTKNAEGYFLIGYSVKPERLGVTEEEIELVRLTCQIDSWFGKQREFVKVSDVQILSYWDGVIFFLASHTTKTRAAAGSGPSTLLITPHSVGMLNPNSDLNEKNLKIAFPSYLVEKKAVTQMAFPYFELYRQGRSMLEVYPNPTTQKVAYVRIFDKIAQAPALAKIGAVYAEVFKNDEQIIDCQAGIKDRSGQTLCSFKNMSTIQYVFEPKSDKELSPIDALNQAQLVEIVWKADSALITDQVFTNRSSANLATTTPLTAQAEYDILQKRVDELYERIKMAFEKTMPATKTLNQTDKLVNFINAQRAWTLYRDDHCHWHSALVKDDTAKTNKIFVCLLRMTRVRVDEMEQILKQLEQ
jgi:uncharacterized protein YecT (DUF1311 family)